MKTGQHFQASSWKAWFCGDGELHCGENTGEKRSQMTHYKSEREADEQEGKVSWSLWAWHLDIDVTQLYILTGTPNFREHPGTTAFYHTHIDSFLLEKTYKIIESNCSPSTAKSTSKPRATCTCLTSKDGDSTTSQGCLIQCFTIYPEKNLFFFS